MPRDSSDLFDLQHPLGWNVLPLSYGLRGDFVVQGAGKPRIAPNGSFCLFQGGRFQFGYSLGFAHAVLKA
jgi:hypothetical protein